MKKMTLQKQKIARIIPFKKLPRSMNYFDYLITEKQQKAIKIGSLVEIPFKNSALFGIVAQICDHSAFKNLKELSRVNLTTSYLAKYQLDFINWFSQENFISKATTLKLIAPLAPQKASKVKARDLFSKTPQEIQLTPNITKLSNSIIKNKNDKKYLIFSENFSQKQQLLFHLITQVSKKDEQLLILVPQKFLIAEILKLIPLSLREKTAVITNNTFTSKNRQFETWQNIKNNNIKIIIGTRSAIFLPFSKLQAIYINFSDSEDYKNWDQTPRYSTIESAKKIQELTNCKLFLDSTVPRIEDYYLAGQESYKLIKLSTPNKSVKIIDLKAERKIQFTYLSDELINEITAIVEQKKQVLLIVNKKGQASNIICYDCKYVAKCPTCNLNLTLSDNKLRCFNCKKEYPQNLTCPKCHGTNIKSFGIGLEQILKIIKTLFPQVEISDSLEKKALIYVITNSLNENPKLQELGLLAFVYLDSILYLPDYSSNYKFFQMIHDTINKINFIHQNNFKVLLQTFFPDNLAVQNINSYPAFYKQEITSRKQFNYPPFINLIKIFFQHHDKNICIQEANEMHKTLLQNKINCTPVYLYYKQFIRGRYRVQITLKLNKKDYQRFLENKSIIPSYWTIDNRPLDML